MARRAEAVEPETGFYASGMKLNSTWAYVFAYDEETADATWLRQDGMTMVYAEPEVLWQLPDDPADFGEFCFQHGFRKVTLKEALPAIRSYLAEVVEMISPENAADMLHEPATAVGYVRAVRSFIDEVEEL